MESHQKRQQVFLIFLISFAFLSRLITYFTPIPNILNLIIYPLVFFVFIFFKLNNRIENNNISILLFFFIVLLSSIFNHISLTNFFLFLIIVLFPIFIIKINKNLDFEQNHNLLRVLNLLFWFNFAVSLYQYLILGYQDDDIKGVFLGQGLGHHINGALAYYYMIFYIFNKKLKIGFKTLLVSSLCLFLGIITDTKSMILVLLISLFISYFVMILKYSLIPNLKIIYFIAITIISLFFISFLLQFGFEKFEQLSHISYDYLYEGFEAKFSYFAIINFENFKNILFGLGPGMTFSKLASIANTDPRYFSLLSSIKYEMSKMSVLIDYYMNKNFYTNPTTGSSLFQFNTTFFGIIGDIGLIGYIIYSLMISKTILTISNNFYTIYILVSLHISGWVFSWLEESIFMTFIICLIYLNKDVVTYLDSTK